MEVDEAARVVPRVDLAADDRRQSLVVRAPRSLERAGDRAGLADELALHAVRARNLHEVRLRFEVGRDVALAGRGLDPLAPAERAVVEHDPDDRRAVLD